MRGRSRSESVENTMKVAREIADSEIKEIILTGVNIGDFGRQNGEKFIDLLVQLDQLKGISRIRISSIEPELLTEEILQLVSKSSRLLPHFHIPLQSGTNKILELMKRKYKREVSAERVLRIKELMPDACIAADVIVGFPGETEEDFQDTLQFIENLPVTYLHVFTYSERPGTRALQLEGKVGEKEKRSRSQILHALSETKKMNFYNSQLGKTVEVLWESDQVQGYMRGWSENYIHCRTAYDPRLVNQVTTCKLMSIIKEKDLICEVALTEY
jgi:threonylcarbamoyladenosine tRNA methylthiotransferase MtaB